ncbi:PH domain-containing protein [Haloarchaeobius amylolyticus]|uniref:PH domain-containing protein n=1 Tax=Haloarchaeobius amylolyticus TaxID=1198296 RepID=UPI0022722933|nr:PH domain-containing protein [Haloarchaeobius amylolyticus]
MRLHPISAVSRALRYGVNGLSIPFFLVAMLSAAGIGSIDWLFLVAPVGLVVGVTYGVMTYLRYDYALSEDTFDVAQGVIGRTEREIPLRRIQNVDVSQNVFHRLFGVAVVRIETAGGGGTEATLSVVAEAEASRLRREIRERRAKVTGEAEARETGEAAPTDAASDSATGATADASTDTTAGQPADPARAPPGQAAGGEQHPGEYVDEATAGKPTTTHAPTSEVLFELRPVELLALAVTRFRFRSVVLLVVAIPFVEDFAIRLLLDAAAPLGGPAALDPGVMTRQELLAVGLVGPPLILLASILTSVVLSTLEFYDFELGREGDDLVYERGLLQRYSGSIPREKVQTISLTETFLMRPLGFAGLTVETAGYAGSRASQGSQAAVPIAKLDRTLELARELEDFPDLEFTRPPKRARRRYAVRYSIPIVLLLAVAYAVSAMVTPIPWYLPAAAFVAVPFAAHLKWANRGFAVGEDHLLIRDGFWNRTTRVVPYYRIQTVVSEATVFQRRLDLATLVADTASSATLLGGSPTAFDLDESTVDELQSSLRERLQASLHGA